MGDSNTSKEGERRLAGFFRTPSGRAVLVVVALLGAYNIYAGVSDLSRLNAEDGGRASQQTILSKVAKDVEGELTEWKSAQIPFSIKYPQKWAVRPERPAPFIFGAHAQDNLVNINVTAEPVTGMDTKQFSEATLEAVKRAVKTTVVSQEALDLNGCPANKCLLNSEFEGTRVQQVLVMLAKADTGYVVTISMPHDAYEKLESVVSQIINSVNVSG